MRRILAVPSLSGRARRSPVVVIHGPRCHTRCHNHHGYRCPNSQALLTSRATPATASVKPMGTLSIIVTLRCKGITRPFLRVALVRMPHCSASQLQRVILAEWNTTILPFRAFLVFSRCVRPSLQALVLVVKYFFVQALTSSTDIVNPVSRSHINLPVEFLLNGDGISECTVEFLQLFYHPQ